MEKIGGKKIELIRRGDRYELYDLYEEFKDTINILVDDYNLRKRREKIEVIDRMLNKGYIREEEYIEMVNNLDKEKI